MKYRDDEYNWEQKYRPRTIEDCILPAHIKHAAAGIIKVGRIPNLLLTHPSPGIGKTTLAMVLCKLLDVDVMCINASLHANMDALRNSVAQFASKASFDQKQKVIFWDEADGISRGTQEALRAFIETYSANCTHIFTANYEHKIIPHIRGRCDKIDFDIPANEKPKLAKQLIKRLKFILDSEGVEYSEEVLVELVIKKFPNYRNILITLQSYANAEGKIDSGILTSLAETSYKELITFLKNKEFNKMRKWVADNCTSDPSYLFTEFYEFANDHLQDESIPDMILTLAKYQANVPLVANQEINTASCLTELMMLEGWK